MKRIAALALMVAVLLPALAHARKTTYIATNHRFNYVKLKEVKPKVAAERNMTHPSKLDEQGVREALKSVKLSRSYVVKKEVDTQRVFDNVSISFLAPNIAKAFTQATDREEIIFSFLMKNPRFILRNDRLNLGKMWITGNELHIRFTKLFAKVTGDIDKRGNEAKAIARSRGLRIKLELGPGQQMSFEDTNEMILDLRHNYAEMPESAIPVSTTTKTMSGETVPVPGMATTIPAATTASADTMASSGTLMATTTTTTPTAASTFKQRIQTLDSLKKDGTITNQEYKEKRKEILKDL